MGSVVRTVSKPFEWVGKAASNVISSIGGLLTPKMPDLPVIEPTPPAEPAGPGASASESSEAQNERLRILAAKSRKKTRTMLTSAQGVQEAAGAVKKKLLGE